MKRSDLGNFAIINLNYFLLQFFLSILFKIESAGVVFWESMRVAKDQSTFAFKAEETDFFLAIKATFPINLLRLLDMFFYSIRGVLSARGLRTVFTLLNFTDNFLFFFTFIFSSLDTNVLETRGAKALISFWAEKEHASFAHALVGFLNLTSLDAHVIILSKKCENSNN